MKQIIDVAVGHDADTGNGLVLLTVTLAEDRAQFNLTLSPKDASNIGKLLTNAGLKAATMKHGQSRIVVPQ